MLWSFKGMMQMQTHGGWERLWRSPNAFWMRSRISHKTHLATGNGHAYPGLSAWTDTIHALIASTAATFTAGGIASYMPDACTWAADSLYSVSHGAVDAGRVRMPASETIVGARAHARIPQGSRRLVFMHPPCIHGLPSYSQPCWRITRTQQIGIHASTMRPLPALMQPAMLAYHKDPADLYSCFHHASMDCPCTASHVGVSQGHSRSIFMHPPYVHGLPTASHVGVSQGMQQTGIHAFTMRPWPTHAYHKDTVGEPTLAYHKDPGDRYSCVHHAGKPSGRGALYSCVLWCPA